MGRSQSTFNNYSRHVAAISLYFGKIPTELYAEQVQDYLFYQQKKSKTPSQTYFKHCVYGLRFLLKSESLPYEFLRLPSIKHEKKLPVVLSKEEVWAMLQNAKLLKHKILIGLLYGCGLRCMEARGVRLQDLDFDRKQLKVVQGKGKKDRYVPLSEHLIRGLKKYIEAEKPQEYLFNGQPLPTGAGGILTIVTVNAACNGRLSKWPRQQELSKKFTSIPCDTLMLLICWKMAWIL